MMCVKMTLLESSLVIPNEKYIPVCLRLCYIHSNMDFAVTTLHQLATSLTVELSPDLYEKDHVCIKTSTELGKISQWVNHNEEVN